MAAGAQGAWAEADYIAHIVPGTVVRHLRHAKKGKCKPGRVGVLPALENVI